MAIKIEKSEVLLMVTFLLPSGESTFVKTFGTFTGDNGPGRGGSTLGISGWGCAAGTLEPLTYTRASSAEFCYPILE